MSIQFDGVVRAVDQPEQGSYDKGGESREYTRLRVVSESGPKVAVAGSEFKEHQNKDFFDVVGFGRNAKALSYLNPGESVHLRGDLRQGKTSEVDGEKFYPNQSQMVVTQVDFIPNQSVGKSRSNGASMNADDPTRAAGAEAADDGVEVGF